MLVTELVSGLVNDFGLKVGVNPRSGVTVEFQGELVGFGAWDLHCEG